MVLLGQKTQGSLRLAHLKLSFDQQAHEDAKTNYIAFERDPKMIDSYDEVLNLFG